MSGKVLETESDHEKLQSIDATKGHSFRSMKMSSSFAEEGLDSKEFNRNEIFITNEERGLKLTFTPVLHADDDLKKVFNQSRDLHYPASKKAGKNNLEDLQ